MSGPISSPSQRIAYPLIGVRDSGHETVFEGPQDQGARRRRPRDAARGGGRDLRRLGADREALAEAAPRDGRRRSQATFPPAREGRALEEALPAQVSRNPDLTLEEHRELFYDERGVAVPVSSVSRAFGRLGLPLKKSPSRPPSATRPKGRAGTRG